MSGNDQESLHSILLYSSSNLPSSYTPVLGQPHPFMSGPIRDESAFFSSPLQQSKVLSTSTPLVQYRKSLFSNQLCMPSRALQYSDHPDAEYTDMLYEGKGLNGFPFPAMREIQAAVDQPEIAQSALSLGQLTEQPSTPAFTGSITQGGSTPAQGTNSAPRSRNISTPRPTRIPTILSGARRVHLRSGRTARVLLAHEKMLLVVFYCKENPYTEVPTQEMAEQWRVSFGGDKHV